jgi:hypothetical protein
MRFNGGRQRAADITESVDTSEQDEGEYHAGNSTTRNRPVRETL